MSKLNYTLFSPYPENSRTPDGNDVPREYCLYPNGDSPLEGCLNSIIEKSKPHGLDTNLISDGFHSFGELYEHRIELWITLCRWFDMLMKNANIESVSPWRSQNDSEGKGDPDWFMLGLGWNKGEQMTYHLPISKWDECSFAETLDKAPEWDGHTSADVLERLKKL